MRKYVRTNNKIYKFDGIMFDRIRFIDIETGEDRILSEDKDDYEIADTIEELCDEFVLFSDNKAIFISDDLCAVESLSIKYEKVIIYGAIWTSKGLLYVAKANKDGEFKLL